MVIEYNYYDLLHKQQAGRNDVSSAKRKEDVATETPVDLGPLGDSFGYLLRRAQVAVFQRFFDLFAEFDIRPAQYSVLTVIERNPGLSQTRLADALGIKKTNLVAIIDTLEERGLARRRPTENDRRSHALFLTPKGTVLIGRLHQRDAALDQGLSRLMNGNERQRFCDVLRQVASE
ncbi:MAG: MarR family transcriptional regulator [Reyranella sp.]|nr:MarR family transcriptional regulator [Reyranella sp.]